MPGHAKGTPGHHAGHLRRDLIPYAKRYQAYAEAGLKVLARETSVLAADVRANDLTAAKRDWLTAHLQYQTLGAAYGTFGDYDDEIDGRADVTGVNSPQWTGFYRLEYGLWHGQSGHGARAGRRDARQERERAARLVADAGDTAGPTSGLRTHEILENALQFQLTGHDDYGSGTTLATTLANLAGHPRRCSPCCTR